MMGREATKHRLISRRLHTDIVEGKYREGARLPSETQLVKQFGVSRPTVARALRDLIDQDLVERRVGSGTYVRMGGAPRVGTRTLGLLIPGLATTEVFESICGELASLARAHGFHLLWGGSGQPRLDRDASPESPADLCERFIAREVSGVFFAPCEWVPQPSAVNGRMAESLRQAGIPVILLDRDLQMFPRRSDFDLVGLDNVAAGYLLAEHLLKLGCRHIHFVARPFSAPTVDARLVGVRDAMVRCGLEPDSGWIHLGDPTDLRFVRGLMAGRQADAFVCANDVTATALLRSLEVLDYRVPRDVRIAGFDDLKQATQGSVPLTTVHQPCREIATVAFAMMRERMTEPSLPARGVALTPRLVVRESCGAYWGSAGG